MAKNILKAALSSMILVGMAGAALAAPAVATSNVNVRSGPGTDYQAVNTLRRGERVDVEGCQAGWCYIDGRGVEGWVSWRYLAETARPNRPATVFQFNFGSPPRWEHSRPRPNPPGHSRPGHGRPGDNWDGPGRPGNDWNGPGRPGRPGDDRPGDGRPGDGRPGDDRPGDGRPGDGRPGDGRPGDGRPGPDRGRGCEPISPRSPVCR